MHLFNQKCHGEMIPTGVTRLLVVLLCVTTVSCLQCYECVREDNKDAEKYCALSSASELGNNTKVNCSAVKDRCLIQKRIKGKSIDMFKRKCVKESDCTNNCSPPNEAGVRICDSCCDKDLCNTGEGPTGAPQTSGSSGIHMILGLSLVGPLLIWFL